MVRPRETVNATMLAPAIGIYRPVERNIRSFRNLIDDPLRPVKEYLALDASDRPIIFLPLDGLSVDLFAQNMQPNGFEAIPRIDPRSAPVGWAIGKRIAIRKVAVGHTEHYTNIVGSANSNPGKFVCLRINKQEILLCMEPRISIVTLGVKDLERSLRFYRDGLGFPTTRKAQDPIVFFQTSGTCLAIYPYQKLAEDVSKDFVIEKSKFTGITLAHNVRTRDEMDKVLAQAKQAGGKIEKPARQADWGGYSGYFSDPDGYLWEVACGAFEMRPDGSLIVP
jgi:catechol 2,3-dioxygenase-like lactoylglutathione lyase family enzyme